MTPRSALLLLPLLFPLAAAAAEQPAAGGAGTLVVLNKSDHTASLLRLPDGAVRATLPTGYAPHEVAVAPDGRTVAPPTSPTPTPTR